MFKDHPAQTPAAATSPGLPVGPAPREATDDAYVRQPMTAEGEIEFLFGRNRRSLMLWSTTMCSYVVLPLSVEPGGIDTWVDSFGATEVCLCDTDGLIRAIRSPTEHPETNLVLKSQSSGWTVYLHLLKEPVWKRDLHRHTAGWQIDLFDRFLWAPLTGDGEWEVVRASNARRWSLDEVGQVALYYHDYWSPEEF